MSGGQEAWETRLLSMAAEGLDSPEPEATVTASESRLERAFAHCEAITRRHSRTFHFASGLLPRPKRRAARALYAFCRTTDDIVDQADHDPLAALDRWRRRSAALSPPENDGVLTAWAKTRATYRIPRRYAEQLIDGVAQDLTKTRYADFGELAEYCYGVASTVGLMSMHIMGFAGPEALPYAIKMGVALQMTNILRDVGEDWQRGRVYLPQGELAAFGLSDKDIAAGHVDDRWRAFMRDQIARAHRLYDESWPGIALLHRDGQFSIAAAADLYRAILAAIEANRYDVFHRRAHIGLWSKIARLPVIWRRVRRLRKARSGPRL
jgi:phytoene synthase